MTGKKSPAAEAFLALPPEIAVGEHPCCRAHRRPRPRSSSPPLIAQAVRLDGDRLIRTQGHFSGREITGEKFLATIDGARFQLDAPKVREYLADPTAGRPMRFNRRNGRTGNLSRKARKIADHKVMALMIERPTATVSQMAAMLGISHPSISRRIARLRSAGVIGCGEDGWEVETPVAAHAAHDDDGSYIRAAVVTVLRSYSAISAYRLAKLTGRTKHQTANALVELAAQGLAFAVNNHWSLTQAALKPPPVSVVKRPPIRQRDDPHHQRRADFRVML
jgi:hypothetical protein